MYCPAPISTRFVFDLRLSQCHHRRRSINENLNNYVFTSKKAGTTIVCIVCMMLADPEAVQRIGANESEFLKHQALH